MVLRLYFLSHFLEIHIEVFMDERMHGISFKILQPTPSLQKSVW